MMEETNFAWPQESGRTGPEESLIPHGTPVGISCAFLAISTTQTWVLKI
jgi:hypothetical protein